MNSTFTRRTLALPHGDGRCKHETNNAKIEQAKDIVNEVKRTNRELQAGEIIEKGLIGKVRCAQSTYSVNSVYGVWQYEVEREATPRDIYRPPFLITLGGRPPQSVGAHGWKDR